MSFALCCGVQSVNTMVNCTMSGKQIAKFRVVWVCVWWECRVCGSVNRFDTRHDKFKRPGQKRCSEIATYCIDALAAVGLLFTFYFISMFKNIWTVKGKLKVLTMDQYLLMITQTLAKYTEAKPRGLLQRLIRAVRSSIDVNIVMPLQCKISNCSSSSHISLMTYCSQYWAIRYVLVHFLYCTTFLA
jgi:hypothetical protein